MFGSIFCPIAPDACCIVCADQTHTPFDGSIRSNLCDIKFRIASRNFHLPRIATVDAVFNFILSDGCHTILRGCIFKGIPFKSKSLVVDIVVIIVINNEIPFADYYLEFFTVKLGSDINTTNVFSFNENAIIITIFRESDLSRFTLIVERNCTTFPILDSIIFHKGICAFFCIIQVDRNGRTLLFPIIQFESNMIFLLYTIKHKCEVKVTFLYYAAIKRCI